MGNISLFILFVCFYLILTIFLSIYRKNITYRGIFFSFIVYLLVFIVYLLFNFYSIILLENYLEFRFYFSNISWLSLDLSLSFRLDSLSFCFCLLVLIIGFSANLYIPNYFKYEANEDNFTILINWFILSMLTLVLANNTFTLFLGWESIGLTSFFLINFWSNRRGTLKSSFKAFTFNKVSDVFLFVFIVGISYILQTTNISLINLKLAVLLQGNSVLLTYITISLVICSMFKSAQLFAHLWLPDSMEAPVPASALIHSATLVSAGLYLLLRFSTLITICNLQMLLVTIGSITALYGGIVSAAQTDMKKLLAYSTISHCGFLFLTIGLEAYIASIIYLFLHGLFKALTFFCSGTFIRVFGSQDTRNMGCGSKLLPVDSILLVLCAVNLGGLPFTFGYLYKSTLFISLLNVHLNFIIFGMCYLALLTGIIYIYRLVQYTLFDITKEHVNQMLLELQLKQNKFINNWSLTSILQIISVVVMFTFVVYIYIIFSNLFLNNSFFFTQTFFNFNDDNTSSIWNSSVYSVYYEVFYNLYFLIILLLSVVVWRYNYTINYRYWLFTIMSYIFFISLFFFMWGHILTEASTQQNFNFGFSTYKSEVLIHLSQWQYWWWFWFSIWWSLYYFIILKLITKRTFNFNPVINTSIRGHGKWGDFLVALIPLSWCCNILINSNFILRMIEWQNESSLFTIRVQGKQWYWVYKFDPNTSQAINTTPKNIGHNRWVIFGKNESYHADSYYQAIHLAAQLEFQDSYTSLIQKNETNKISLNTSSLINDSIVLTTNWQYNAEINNVNKDFNFSDFSSPINDNLVINYNKPISDFNIKNPVTALNYINSTSKFNTLNQTTNAHNFTNNIVYFTDVDIKSALKNINSTSVYETPYYDFIKLDETSDSTGNIRSLDSTQPFRIIRGLLNQHVIHILQESNENNMNKLLLFHYKIINSGESNMDKELIPETLWGFRQKKYKRVKKFNFKPQAIYDPVTFKVLGFNNINTNSLVDIAGIDLSYATLRKNKQLSYSNMYNYYLSMKVNRNKSELVPVTLARRLLRTKRTLVLPAHVNLTVITNSYDVVHSWFIPGLGLKLDCVPGRSTHHTFYIDNIGFYYGQCAEICGRYHHHMPIRLCALPFEQFVVWWQSKGLPRLNRLTMINKNKFFSNTFDKSVTFKKLIYQNS